MLFLHAVSSDSAWSDYNTKFHFVFLSDVIFDEAKLQFLLVCWCFFKD